MKWLAWAQKIQALSQSGLAYCKDVYDIERYEELRALSIEILETYTGMDPATIKDVFASESGYATPKVDIRGVVLQKDRILLVREKEDGAWALPGGWADIGMSPTEIVVKEVREESGYEVSPVRLLAVLDRQKHPHPPSAHHIYKLFILCKLVGGEATNGIETSGVDFFPLHQLPPLSIDRNTASQLELMFQLANDPTLGPVID